MAANIALTDSLWQNRFDPIDVNRDGFRAPNDLLIVVNDLNRGNSGQLMQPRQSGDSRSLPDVNGDGWLTPFHAKTIAETLQAEMFQFEGEDECPTVSVTLTDLVPGGAPAEISEHTLFVISGTATNASSVSITGTGYSAIVDPPPEPYPRFEFDSTTGAFRATVIYFDDGHSSPDPSAGATSEDLQTITATATNGCNSASDSMDVLVKNISPSILQAAFTEPEISEGDTAILQLEVAEASPYDTIRITIDWGDGTQDIRSVGSGPPNIDPNLNQLIAMEGLPQPTTYQLGIEHIYRDDDPTWTPQDTYQVSIAIADDDLGTDATTTSIVVHNVAPQIFIDEIIPIDKVLPEFDPNTGWPLLLNPGQIDESEGFRVKGHVTDVGLDDTHTGTVKVDLNWDGDFSDSGETISITGAGGLWSFVATFGLVPDDGPSHLPWPSNDTLSDALSIRIDVSDDDLGSNTHLTETTVFNTPPLVFIDDVVLTPDPVDEAAIGSITLQGHVTDFGTLDLHEIAITWADGLTETQITSTHDFSFTRTLDSPYADEHELLFPVSVVAKDDDRSQGETSVPKVNLQIGHGISHEYVEDKYEVRYGSYTVANLNDTDGDGIVDKSDDNGVIDVVHNGQFNEVDLMPIRVFKPVPYDPAKSLTLTATGPVKFWADKNKQTAADVNTVINNWPDGVTSKQLWTEVTAVSSVLKDVVLELKYDKVTDLVKSSGIWATFEIAVHSRKTPAELLAQFPDIHTGDHLNIETSITKTNGTGLLPVQQIVIDNVAQEVILNGILIKFVVSPKELKHIDEVKIDMSRRVDWDHRQFDPTGAQINACHLPFPPIHPDATNDDPSDSDESNNVGDLTGNFYSYDSAGVETTALGNLDRELIIAKYEEFIRVNIGNNATRPVGGVSDHGFINCNNAPTVSGSRASDRFRWKLKHTLDNVNGALRRSTGDQMELPENHIDEGN